MFRDPAWRIVLPALGLVLAAGCAKRSDQPPGAAVPSPIEPLANVEAAERVEVVVLAAASLTGCFTKLAEQAEGALGAKVNVAFGGSQQLRASIEQGNAADVFASANMDHIEALREADLIQDAFEFAHNRIALIVPQGNPAGVETLADVGTKDLKLVVAVNDCPVGRYTRKVLAKCDESPNYPSDFSEQALARLVSEDVDVKQVLSKVALGAADAGFVYVSDLTDEAREKVSEIEIPEEVQQVATYGVGVPATTENPQGGRKFIEYLVSEEGRHVISRTSAIQFIDSARPPWTDG